MYYAGALTLGSHGINALGEFAKQFEVEAKRIERTSPQKVFQNVTGVCYPNAHCFELLKKGKRVFPEEVALFIAIDNEPNHVLKPLLQMLPEYRDWDRIGASTRRQNRSACATCAVTSVDRNGGSCFHQTQGSVGRAKSR